jgi:hypothetical protein
VLWFGGVNTVQLAKPKVGNLGMDLATKVRDRNNARCWNLKGHQLPRRNGELVEKLTPEQIDSFFVTQFIWG